MGDAFRPTRYSCVVDSLGSAGRRKRHKGGFLGQVVNNAIVPFGILGLQQTFGRKKSGYKKTRRYKH